MNKKAFLAVMLGLLCSRGVFAEDATPSYTMDEVVVSATKTLNSIADAGGSSVTVISADEIENSGQETVEEVLKSVPGIDVAANGGPGTTTSIFLRGADSKNVLLLIDGIPSNDPSAPDRAAYIANLTVDSIERIEVVRGPVSVLYGSNATAGVINIITKKGGPKPSSYVGIEGGSFATYKVYGGTSGSLGAVDYAFGLSRFKADGYSVADEDNPTINPGGIDFEDDGYENNSWTSNIGLKLSDAAHLRTILRYTDATVQYDSPGSDNTTNSQDSENLIGKVAFTLKTNPLISTFYYDFNDIDRRLPSGTSKGNLYDLGWQGDLVILSDNTVSVGLNLQNERLRLSGLDRNVNTKSAFLQDQWHIGGLNIVGAVRIEDHDTFGNKTTYRFAPSYEFGNSTLKFSYGTGFVAPSLNQLYGPYGANDKLKPESSEGWDAGIEHKIKDNLKLGATYFRTDYDNRIDWVGFGMDGSYAQVVGKTKTLGVESFAEWEPFKPLFLALNYTYTYTRDALGSELVRRPKNKVGLVGTWKATDKAKLYSNLQWVGSRKDSYAPTGKLDSYFLANVSLGYQLQRNVELYGRIDNLFDEYYEEAWGYATPGRSAFAGVKLTF